MDTFKKIIGGTGKLLKKIKWVIIFLIIGFIGITAFKYNANKKLMEIMSEVPSQDTVQLEKRDVLNTITATGKIESAKTRTVASTIVKDTKITAVNCEEGDFVNEGDILVTFSYEEINKSIAELQEDIAESKATKAVNDTSNTRSYYYAYGTETLTMRDLQQDIDERQKDLNEACDALGDARRKLDDIKNMGEDNPNYSVKDSLVESQENVVASAYKAMEQAQLAYDKAVQALNDEIYKGSNSLAQSTENYEKNVITSNDSTKNLQRQLEKYKDSLDDYVITAPISGTVTAVNVEENNSFSGGNMVTIQDCSTLYVSTEIDEYDIPDIQIGQRVVIKTDATREDELEGVVDSIKATATATSSGAATTGSSTYAVKIRITDTDERLKLGMTAKLSIILEERDDVLAIPYNAIVEKEDGSKVIRVATEFRESESSKDKIENMDKAELGDIAKDSQPVGDFSATSDMSGEMSGGGFSLKKIFDIAYGSNVMTSDTNKFNEKEIPVEVGLESDYYSEVSGPGIVEGLTVIVPDAESDNNDFFMGGFGGPM